MLAPRMDTAGRGGAASFASLALLQLGRNVSGVFNISQPVYFACAMQNIEKIYYTVQ